MYVKPKDGRLVPDPARGDLLPEAGRNVDASSYWYRREVAGDIDIIGDGQQPSSETGKKVGDK